MLTALGWFTPVQLDVAGGRRGCGNPWTAIYAGRQSSYIWDDYLKMTLRASVACEMLPYGYLDLLAFSMAATYPNGRSLLLFPDIRPTCIVCKLLSVL